MVETPERDTSLLLDMLLAARDARGFLTGLDEPAFLASRLHQNAVSRSLEVIGEAAGRVRPPHDRRTLISTGATSPACAIA